MIVKRNSVNHNVWKHISAVIPGLAVIAILGLGFYAGMMRLTDKSTFLQGTSVNGVDISALSSDSAVDKLVSAFESGTPGISITVTCEGVSRVFTEKDAEYSNNAREVYDGLLSGRLEGSVTGKMNTLYALRAAELQADVAQAYNYNSLFTAVQAFARQFERQPTDAGMAFHPNAPARFTFISERPGVYLDADALMKTLWSRFQTRNEAPVNVELQVIPARITRETLSKGAQLIGTCTTLLDAKNTARTNNIDLISAAVNGAAVPPGGTFSVNETSGKRTAEKGYLPARAIVNGEYVDEYGGGVCQLSGTLYNAALLADLEIVSRKRHTRPSTYLPLGLDAVIDFDSKKDLIFRNNTDVTVYVEVMRKENDLTVNLYGAPSADGLRIELVSDVVRTIDPGAPVLLNDPTLPAGTKVLKSNASKGHQVKTYRNYYRGETLVHSEALSTDYYQERKGVYHIGTQQAPQPELVPGLGPEPPVSPEPVLPSSPAVPVAAAVQPGMAEG